MPSPATDPRYVDYLVKLAAENIGRGVIEEPRLYFDMVTLRSTQPLTTDFTNNVFRNGEQFPVRLTHLVLSPRPDFNQSTFTDERLIQRVALRLRFHDTYYQNQQLLPVPLWVNKVTAASDLVSLGTSQWTLDRPAILSARDAMRIEFRPEVQTLDASSARYVSASATGVGLLSKRPYFLAATQLVSTTAAGVLSTLDFKNDGTEPIAITDVSFSFGAAANASSAQGDIRRCMFQVTLLGNGTQQPWFVGSATPTTPVMPFCPGQLLGITTGRAAVHRFPGEGVLWEPGEGCTVEAQSTVSGSTGGMAFLVAMAGYITVE